MGDIVILSGLHECESADNVKDTCTVQDVIDALSIYDRDSPVIFMKDMPFGAIFSDVSSIGIFK